jgi:hypothetical protein
LRRGLPGLEEWWFIHKQTMSTGDGDIHIMCGCNIMTPLEWKPLGRVRIYIFNDNDDDMSP